MLILAFLPQHVWQVIATVMAVLFVRQGIVLLIRGNMAPEAEWMGEGTVRVAACFILLIGVGIGLAGFMVHAEAPSAHGGEGWGGTAGVVLLGVWLALMGAIEVFKLRKARQIDRDD